MMMRISIMKMMMMIIIMEEKKEKFACCAKSFIADPSENLDCFCLMFVSHAYYFALQTHAVLQYFA